MGSRLSGKPERLVLLSKTSNAAFACNQAAINAGNHLDMKESGDCLNAKKSGDCLSLQEVGVL